MAIWENRKRDKSEDASLLSSGLSTYMGSRAVHRRLLHRQHRRHLKTFELSSEIANGTLKKDWILIKELEIRILSPFAPMARKKKEFSLKNSGVIAFYINGIRH